MNVAIIGYGKMGKEVEKIAYQYGGAALMNEDNKNMLEKVKEKQIGKVSKSY